MRGVVLSHSNERVAGPMVALPQTLLSLGGRTRSAVCPRFHTIIPVHHHFVDDTPQVVPITQAVVCEAKLTALVIHATQDLHSPQGRSFLISVVMYIAWVQ